MVRYPDWLKKKQKRKHYDLYLIFALTVCLLLDDSINGDIEKVNITQGIVEWNNNLKKCEHIIVI